MVQSGNETRHSELNTGVLNYSARGHFLSLPVVALLFGITINSVQGFRFLHILINIYIMFFYKSHPKTSEVMLLCLLMLDILFVHMLVFALNITTS